MIITKIIIFFLHFTKLYSVKLVSTVVQSYIVCLKTIQKHFYSSINYKNIQINKISVSC